MRNRTFAICCLAGILTSCGGGSISGSLIDKYRSEEQAIIPAAAVPTPEETNPVPYVEEAVGNTEFATIPESETSQILTTANFLFDTSKSIQLRIDLAQPAGTQSSLSICTDYETSESGFLINYNSCAIKATMQNGQFEQQMKLMNQIDSAIAVIWFPNQEFEPIYNEIQISDLARNENGYVWNWN